MAHAEQCPVCSGQGIVHNGHAGLCQHCYNAAVVVAADIKLTEADLAFIAYRPLPQVRADVCPICEGKGKLSMVSQHGRQISAKPGQIIKKDIRTGYQPKPADKPFSAGYQPRPTATNEIVAPPPPNDDTSTAANERPCHGCEGKGWILLKSDECRAEQDTPACTPTAQP